MAKSKKEQEDKRLANLKPFEKGQSGNPNGRPKGAKTRSKIIEKLLNVELSDDNLFVQAIQKEFPELIEASNLTVQELIMIRLIRQALMGTSPVGAVKELLDRLDGRTVPATDPDKDKPTGDEVGEVVIIRLPHNKRNALPKKKSE